MKRYGSINYLQNIFLKNHVKAKFIIVGIWNTFFGYAAFWILETILSHFYGTRFFSYMSASIMSHVISTINAFLFHKYITFKSKITGIKVLYEYIRFCLTYTLTFLLSLALLPAFVELLQLSPKKAAAIIVIIGAVISYLGHSRFSFRVREM